jgi:hypothetical protein
MMTSLLTLGLAYALVAALLLALCISLDGRRLLKISLIVLVSAFYSVTWLGPSKHVGLGDVRGYARCFPGTVDYHR